MYKKKNHDCCKKRREDCKKYDDCSCDHKEHKLVRASAFRAVSTVNQNVTANTFVKVLFQDEQFDLANEYNPTTSDFIPETRGVYSVIGTISFAPNDSNANYRARVEIRINGNPAIAIDNDFFGPSNFANVVAVSTILELHAGDVVEIFAESDVDGLIIQNDPGFISTHFEAARFPSPIK
ncbi:ABC transporter permease [Bacillus sp. CDB3]|uniref:C1q-like domain-containing protein n=1 Tax=Bacillus sp. CDB3 TaxID=360310 RepID=UPI0009D8A501|nr:ABC transporter permease [Bacillus sp. CDB3]OQR56390.1 ABC transporter permease [Bacillus sp. CDB3]